MAPAFSLDNAQHPLPFFASCTHLPTLRGILGQELGLEIREALQHVREHVVRRQDGDAEMVRAFVLAEAAAGHADDPGLLDQAQAPAVGIQ